MSDPSVPLIREMVAGHWVVTEHRYPAERIVIGWPDADGNLRAKEIFVWRNDAGQTVITHPYGNPMVDALIDVAIDTLDFRCPPTSSQKTQNAIH